MNQERKEEIGKKFLQSDEISTEELKKLEIQELIFLIYSAKYFNEKKVFDEELLNNKIKVFLNTLIEKIKCANELYIAYDKNTNYPYIDSSNKSWIFTKEEYAKNAKDYFMQQRIMLEIKRIAKDEIAMAFSEFHRLGIEKVIVDNGEYNTEINRDDILQPPDWSDTPKISIPIINPKLQNTMINFFQILYSQNNFEGKDRVVHELEGKMLEEVLNAKYLIPMQIEEIDPSSSGENGTITLNKDTKIQFANLVRNDNTSWLPAFTDWVEFEKEYDKNVWNGNIISYDDLLTLSQNIDGIVINFRGISLIINENNKKIIDEYRKRKNNSKSKVVKE